MHSLNLILLTALAATTYGFNVKFPSQDPSTWAQACANQGGNATSYAAGGCCSGSAPLQLWPQYGLASYEDQAPCYPGFFCPFLDIENPSTYASGCAATTPCQNLMLNSQYCSPQSIYQPVVCADGRYCPFDKMGCNLGSSIISVNSAAECNGTFYQWASASLECPEGHYCPAGTVEPSECWALSRCPAGSKAMQWNGSMLCAFGADFFIVLIISYIWKKKKLAAQKAKTDSNEWHEARQRPQDHALEKQDSLRESILSEAPDMADGMAVLLESYQRSKGRVERMDFEFEDLSLTIPEAVCKEKGGKVILNNVSGKVLSNRVTAIMGPSGAGKTTAMSVLMGKIDPRFIRTGTLRINGHECALSKFRQVFGYVPQDDIMMRELTVRDNITHSARCRLSGWSEEDIRKYVDAIMKTLDLYKVAESIIGTASKRGISGGQAKRVNVAMELAAAPRTVFLDEPTSGLDSTSALVLCNALTILAREADATIAMVIHQPRQEIFEALDQLLLLAPGGRTVYQGPQSKVSEYFETVLNYSIPNHGNPADIIMDAIAAHGDEYVNVWIERGRSWMGEQEVSFHHKKPIENAIGTPEDLENGRVGTPKSDYVLDEIVYPEERGASFFKQYYYCFMRSIMQQYYYRMEYIGLEILVSLVAAALVGRTAVAFQGTLVEPYNIFSPAPQYQAMLSMGMIIGFFVAIIAAAPAVKEFNDERVVYWREAASGHNRLAYYIGKHMALLPRIALLSLNFAALYYIQSKPQVLFTELWAIVLFAWYSAYGLAIGVACVLPIDAGPLFATVASIFAALFNSTIVFPKGLASMSFMFWGSEALFTFLSNNFVRIYQVESAADEVGYDTSRITLDFILMVLLGLLFRIFGYFAMIFTNKEKQR